MDRYFHDLYSEGVISAQKDGKNANFVADHSLRTHVKNKLTHKTET